MAPRLQGRRYHDDPGFRAACQRFVAARGEVGYFSDETWRSELGRFARRERPRFGPGRSETPAETTAARLATLSRARAVLREQLGHPVDHLAVPWSRPGPDTSRLAREAGYRSVYSHESPTCRLIPGSDPLALPRVEGYWLRSLPGPARVGIGSRLARRLRRTAAP